MSTLAKAAALSLSLLTGATFAAHAQTNNVAALPPGASAAAPAPVGPSGPYPGPDPGRLWSTQESQTRPVEPSGALPGPDPGRLWSTKESQTQAVAPSGAYPGPKPN